MDTVKTSRVQREPGLGGARMQGDALLSRANHHLETQEHGRFSDCISWPEPGLDLERHGFIGS